jgi:hypothetical protein
MRLMIAAVGVLFAAGLVAADDKKYTSKEGKFAVLFPTDLKVKTDKKEQGGLTLITTGAEDKDAGTAHMVIYTELPPAIKNVPAKTVLDGAAKGAADKSGGKTLETKEIEFGPNKLPGRDLTLDKDGNKVRIKLILAETKLYIVLVGGKKDFATSKEATNFLDSFELTK